jgi:hemoglobin
MTSENNSNERPSPRPPDIQKAVSRIAGRFCLRSSHGRAFVLDHSQPGLLLPRRLLAGGKKLSNGAASSYHCARAAWDPGGMQSVYEAAGGSEGLVRLADAWHSRVMADEIVSHAFSHGFHPQHNQRLAAYWAEALGGPAAYSGTYGDETSVVRIHSGNGPHEEMDRRAIDCFDQAMQDVGLDASGPVRQVLHDYFAWATTTTMSRYHESADEVPDGLRIPRWSWAGLQP